jgi:exo-beta-1,3-glucanase (GH17 family)
MTLNLRQLIAAPIVALATFLLASCGGGGVVPGTGVSLRALPGDFATRQAVAYSPFRSANRDTETITSAMIREDLQLLVKAGVGLIRLFDSSNSVARQTLEVISQDKLDLKVMLGVWIASNADAANQAEIERAVTLARDYPTLISAVSVGNETLVSWTGHKQTAAQLASYIQSVRDRITQPVTTDDNWAVLAARPGEQNIQAVLDAVDFVAMHTYPLLDTVFNPGAWDWKQEAVNAEQRAAAMMDAAIQSAKNEYAAVRANLDSLGFKRMPVIIGETGWKAEPSGSEAQRAHPVNQAMYRTRLNAWRAAAGAPLNIVWFAAFDEPWKQGDDKWGLFDVQRRARCTIQGVHPEFVNAPGSCAATEALYYVPVAAGGPVSASLYRVYRDTATAGEAAPVAEPTWNAWANGTTALATGLSNDSDATDAPYSWRITPRPAVWGWGMALTLGNNAEDLSAFNVASGRLQFSIKTTYPGKIEVGFLTGTATAASLYDVYLAISPGEYGYRADGTWSQVSVPIQAIMAQGARSPVNPGSAAAVLDMTRVTNVFVIGDRYSVTGNGAGNTTPILIDNIFWSR